MVHDLYNFKIFKEILNLRINGETFVIMLHTCLSQQRKKNVIHPCIEIRQHLNKASDCVAWNTGLVCVVCGGRDFDPISSSCHPCVDGWTCDPILRRIGTISSAPNSETAQPSFCWERIVSFAHCYSRMWSPLLLYRSQNIIYTVGYKKVLNVCYVYL